MDILNDKISKIYELDTEIRDNTLYLKSKHGIREEWDIAYHMMQDVLFNIPRLIKLKHGIPAIFHEMGKKAFPNDEKKAWKRGEELYDDELRKVLLYIRLYFYYSNYGIVHKNEKDMVKIDNEYRKTLPNKNSDTYYTELDRLTQNAWNNIWDWVKEWGQYIWD